MILTILCLIGTLAIYLHSYYLDSYFNVHVFKDPRWRNFNFNSRQATEGDIYNVAEIPAVRRVKLVGLRRLRLEFVPPIKASSWTVVNIEDGTVNTLGRHPEVQFRDEPHLFAVKFIPEDVELIKDIIIEFHFYPAENYQKMGLSWDDNYHTPRSSVPFSRKRAYSVDEWVGLPADDPEFVEAKRILGTSIDASAPTLQKAEQVFCFILDKLTAPRGSRPHTDRLQEASPLETYELMSTGQESGACENNSLVYYLFANAAGVKTRLVDIAGKFGPLKLTGHSFCESWIPEEACWCYVDPQSRIVNFRTPEGKLLNFLEVKKVYDLDMYHGCIVRKYDRGTNTLVTKTAEGSGGYYFRGDIVIAYKFGYGRNKSFSKVKDFLSHTTLLYAPLALPRGYLLKYIFLNGFCLGLALTLVSGLTLVLLKKNDITCRTSIKRS